MSDSRGGGIPPRLIIGLVILALGGILALQILGILHTHIHWGDYWPVILIVLGLTRILQRPRHRTGGFVLLFLGCWFLAQSLTGFDLDYRLFFPFLLLVVGGSLVLGSLSGHWRRGGMAAGSGVPAMDGSAVLHPLAILGGAQARSNSQAFEGGSVTAILGSCAIDLREAAIAPGQEARIDAMAFWGGVVIRVPESWSVVIRGVPILGGFHDFTQPPPGGSTQRLVVSGLAIMGGVEVRNRREERP
jgi:hypothetical protein